MTRINQKKYPLAYREAILNKDIPKIMYLETERTLEAEIGLISGAFHQIVQRYEQEKNCNVASAVATYFLRHGVPPKFPNPIKVRVASFLYIGENPATPLENRALYAQIAKELDTIPQQFRTMREVRLDRFYDRKVLSAAFKSQIHHANILPRRNFDGRGRFIYLDLLYKVFEREGFNGDFVFDVVDSETLKSKYGLLPLSFSETRKQQIRADHMVSGEPFDVHDELDTDSTLLAKLIFLQDYRPAAYDSIMERMEKEQEKQNKYAENARRIVEEMTKYFKYRNIKCPQ